MGTKIEYVDSNHLHATNYIRNSKAIAVLWAIFTICYAIISAVAFFTPGNYFAIRMHVFTFQAMLSEQQPHQRQMKMKDEKSHNSLALAWVFHIKIHQIRIEFEWASLLLIYRLVFWLLSFRDVFMPLSSFVIFFLQFGVALGWRMGRRFRFRECWPIGTLASVPTWWNIG